VEGDHELWRNVSGPYRETIRAFLVHFQSQVQFAAELVMENPPVVMVPAYLNCHLTPN
jgi:hypothetical protein